MSLKNCLNHLNISDAQSQWWLRCPWQYDPPGRLVLGEALGKPLGGCCSLPGAILTMVGCMSYGGIAMLSHGYSLFSNSIQL